MSSTKRGSQLVEDNRQADMMKKLILVLNMMDIENVEKYLFGPIDNLHQAVEEKVQEWTGSNQYNQGLLSLEITNASYMDKLLYILKELRVGAPMEAIKMESSKFKSLVKKHLVGDEHNKQLSSRRMNSQEERDLEGMVYSSFLPSPRGNPYMQR